MTSERVQADPASAGVWQTFRESPPAVKTILLGIFVNRLGAFLNIFLVLYLTSKGYSAAEAALALTVYGGGAVLGTLVGGALADRVGARTATMISMVGSAVLIASLLYLPNYALLLVAVGLVSLVGQLYRPASGALMAELTPDNRQIMVFAMYRFGLNLGTMAAPLIGLGLFHLGDEAYTLVFWGEAVAALAYAVLAFFLLPARKTHSAEEGPAEPPPSGSYLTVLRDRRYTLYLIAAFANAVVYMQYLSTLPLDVQASGLDTFWYAAAVSLNGFLVIAFELGITKVSQKWPFRVTIVVAFALVGIGMATYGLPLVPAVIIIGTLIWTMAEIIGGPSGFAYPAVAGPAHLRGRYIGSFQFSFGLGTALGPIIGGALFVQFGHGVWPIIAVGSLVAVACGLVGIVEPPKASTAAEKTDPPPEPALSDVRTAG